MTIAAMTSAPSATPRAAVTRGSLTGRGSYRGVGASGAAGGTVGGGSGIWPIIMDRMLRGHEAPDMGFLLHAERALRLAREELPHEGVVGVEELLGRTGFDDAALPEHGDVLGHAPRGHDVVGDDAERRRPAVTPVGVVHHLL